MSQIEGLVYYITRDGEDGKIGPMSDAVQLSVNSPLRTHLEANRYYRGSKEEWEQFTGLVAGDMDADGDHDRKDDTIIKDVNEQVAEDTAGNNAAIAEREEVEAEAVAAEGAEAAATDEAQAQA